MLPLYVNLDKRYRDREYVKDYITSLPDVQKRELKLIYGHEVHYGIHDWFGREGRYFTFLRDPLSRTISWYNYRRQKDWMDENIEQKFIKRGTTPTIQQWLENSPWVWNEMVGYFADFGYCERKESYSHRELEKILDIFFFVGLTETFDMDALYLYSRIGVKKQFFKPQNISTKYFKADDGGLIERIVLAKNRHDQMLYENAVRRREKMIASDPSYRRRVLQTRVYRAISPFVRRFRSLTGC